MQYRSDYHSPMGRIVLGSDEEGLFGLWFQDQKYFCSHLDPDCREKETDAIRSAKRWLDLYFSGSEPDFTPPLHLIGTEFQHIIWKKLLRIPYGTTTTYGKIARELSGERGGKPVPPRAVGGAVGRNPISIIIPCHRVLGSGGQLTGYAGGLDKKRGLLDLERGGGRIRREK